MNNALTIFAVGDIMLGNQDLCYGFGVKSVIEKKGVDFLFDDVRHIFKNGDIVFGNLEAPISIVTNKEGFDSEIFLCKPEFVFGIKNSCINVLSVANNHIMQHGKEAYISTVNVLKENKISPIGVKNEIRILKIKGFNIAFAGYSFIEDNVNMCLYNKVSSVDTILSDISKVRTLVDLVIISVHWGKEYINYPSPNQLRIGRELIDNGADLILGHHAHVIQGYEIYKNKPIIYGLGNFIFDDTYIKKTQKSSIFHILIDMNSKKYSVNLIPVFCDPKTYMPIISRSKCKNDVLELISDIKSKIENNSVEDYELYFNDYYSLAHFNLIKAKKQMKFHFAKHFLKYPSKYCVSIMSEYLFKSLGR